MLPEGWKRSTVGASCAIRNNLRMPLSAKDRDSMKGPYPYFGPTGQLDSIDHFRIDMPFALIGEDGDHFLKHGSRPMTLFFEGKANVNNHAHVIADSEQCLAKWFYYFFMHRDLTPVLTRQGVGRYKLTKAGLEQLELALPPVAEQRSIARLLETWDNAIEATERLLANSRRQKEDLMSVLLRGQVGGRPDASSLRTVKLSSVFERVARKNAEGNDNVLTISAQQGLISQREFFSKSVASRDLSGYTLLRRGEFAYNKSYSTGYPFGAIKPLLAYEAGVVSSLYLCFKFRDGVDADPDFFRHYFEAGMLEQEIAGIAQEGARNHGLLNVGIDDFFGLQLTVPDVHTQRRLASVLNTAEEEEQSIAAQVEKLRAEKRAIMAEVLTGKRRVRVQPTESTP